MKYQRGRVFLFPLVLMIAAMGLREQKLIAENAPELVGKNFVEAGAHTLTAIDKFKASSSPLVQQVFANAIIKQQAEWSRGGQSMPVWATLSLLRRIEAASFDGGVEQQLLGSLDQEGSG